MVDYQFADLRSSENEALVAKDTHGRYGILAPDGHALSAFEYESAIPYFGGMIVVTKNGLKGAYDHTGKLIAAPLYQNLNATKCDLVPIKKDGAWGWLDLRNGKCEFLDQKFQYTKVLGEDLVVAVDTNDNEMTGFHRNGRVRFNLPATDNATPISDTEFQVLKGREWVYFDFDGKACAAPVPPALSPFFDHGKWGYKAADGSVKIPARFGLAEPFEHGLARVHEGQTTGLIQGSGDWAIGPVYSFGGPGADGQYVLCQSPHSTDWTLADIYGHRRSLPGSYCQVLPRLTSGLFPVREP